MHTNLFAISNDQNHPTSLNQRDNYRSQYVLKDSDNAGKTLYKKYDVISVLTLNDGAFAVTISVSTVVVPKPENSGSLVRPVDIAAGASAPCIARSEAVMESTV